MIPSRKFFLFLILLMACICPHVKAQTYKSRVEGKVVSTTGQAIPYVTVVAQIKGEKGMPVAAAVCDTKGDFSMSLFFRLNYELEFSFAGYKKYKKSFYCDTISPFSLGSIVLEKDTLNLEEVNVSPLLQVSEKEIVYNILADPERERSNMQQIIEKVPGIYFDSKGNIASEDGGSVKVSFNDKDDALLKGVDLETLLSRMPASGMSKVKVIRKPPPKYGDFAYVVELSQDKSKKITGLLFRPSLQYSFDDDGFSPSLVTTGSLGKLRFSSRSSWKTYRFPNRSSYRSLETFADSSVLVQNQESKNKGEEFKNGLFMSLDLAKNHYLGFYFWYNLSKEEGSSTETSEKTFKNEQLENSSVYRNSTQNMDDWRLNFDYEIDFAKKGRTLHFSAFIDGTPKNEQSKQQIQRHLEPDSLTERTNRVELNNTKIRIAYSDNVNKKLELYNYLSYSRRKNTDVWETYSLKDENREKIPAYCSSLQNEIQNLEFGNYTRFILGKNSGLTSNVNLIYPLQDDRFITEDRQSSENYGYQKILVSAAGSLSFRFAKNKLLDRLELNYDFSQLRPGSNYLSVNKEELSENYYSTGNPKLDPEAMHKISVMCSRKNFSPRFEYRFSNNRIGPVLYVDDENNMIKSYANNSRYKEFRTSMSMHFFNKKNPGDMIHANLFASYSDYNTAGEKTYGWTVGAFCMISKKIAKNLDFGSNLSYLGNFKTGYEQSKQDRPFQARSFLSYQLMKKSRRIGNLNIFVDPFAWGDNSRESTHTTAMFQQREKHTQLQRLPIEISAYFTFGDFKVKPVRDFRETKSKGYLD